MARLSCTLLLVVACVCLAASLPTVAAHAPRASHARPSRPTLDSLRPDGEATLVHFNKPAPPQRARELSGGERLDWHKSVFQGVDRAKHVGANVPTQIKLAFIPGGMSVSYATQAKQTSPPSVSYGMSASALAATAPAVEASTYGTQWFYTALLPNLKPATRYYFQVQGTPMGSFVTARAAGDPSSFKVLVVGDMGLYNSADTMRQMSRDLNSSTPSEWFLHVGDISYADDYYLRKNDTYEGSWDQWQDRVAPLTSAAAYMTLPGNHEVTCNEVTPFLCPAYQRNFTAYRNRFRMPWRETGGVENLWYSFDYGQVHFIQINTETDHANSPMGPGTYYNAGPFGDQMSWLAADLAKAHARRSITPWIIVSGHRPLYSSGHEQPAAIAAFEALFVKFEVDMYMAGHVHNYERTWPVTTGGIVTAKSYNNAKGFVCIINGAAGNVEGLNGGAKPAPYSAAANDKDFGYGTLTVANSTHMRWTYLRSADAAVLDDVWIQKHH